MTLFEQISNRLENCKGLLSINEDVYPVDYKSCFFLNVSECKHFRREGIRKGSFILIDTRIPFTEGKVNAFVKFKEDTPSFKLSRSDNPGKGFQYIGQLGLVITRVAGGAE